MSALLIGLLSASIVLAGAAHAGVLGIAGQNDAGSGGDAPPSWSTSVRIQPDRVYRGDLSYAAPTGTHGLTNQDSADVYIVSLERGVPVTLRLRAQYAFFELQSGPGETYGDQRSAYRHAESSFTVVPDRTADWWFVVNFLLSPPQHYTFSVGPNAPPTPLEFV